MAVLRALGAFVLLFVILAACFLSCPPVHSPIDYYQEKSIYVGMGREDLRRLLGDPHYHENTQSGEVWRYVTLGRDRVHISIDSDGRVTDCIFW